MAISIIDLLDYTIVFYVFLCQCTLAFSFSENQSFFVLSALSLVIYKLLRVYFMFQNTIPLIYSKDKPLPQSQVFRCLLGAEKLNLKSQYSFNSDIVVTAFIILFQDLISWRELFSTKDTLSNSQPFHQPQSYTFFSQVHALSYFNMLIGLQLIVALFIKSLTALYFLVILNKTPMVRTNWFQLISLFLGISSLHGFFTMSCLLSPLISDFLQLLAIKITFLIAETAIICILKLDFFNANTENPLEVGFIAGFIQILCNCPANYAPFFSDNWDILDFKQFQLQTQLSIALVKASQTLEMIYLLVQSSAIADNNHNNYDQKWQLQNIAIEFFQFSAVCSIILFCYEIFKKIKEKITRNYQLFGSKSSTVNEVIAVLKNSKHLQFMRINSLTDVQSAFDCDLLKKQELFQILQMQIQKYSPSCNTKEIEVMSMSLVLIKNKYFYIKDPTNQFREIFFQEFSDLSNPEVPLYQLDGSDEYKQKFTNILTRRIYTHGITGQMIKLIEVQSYMFQTIGNKEINQFRSYLLEIMAFKRAVKWCLVVNPVQVLHDLWFEESS